MDPACVRRWLRRSTLGSDSVEHILHRRLDPLGWIAPRRCFGWPDAVALAWSARRHSGRRLWHDPDADPDAAAHCLCHGRGAGAWRYGHDHRSRVRLSVQRPRFRLPEPSGLRRAGVEERMVLGWPAAAVDYVCRILQVFPERTASETMTLRTG